MFYVAIKMGLSALLIVIISEVAKKSSLWGAILASLPLVSILAMLWLYLETKDVKAISTLSWNIFWLVLPSLVLFITLPVFLNQFRLGFYLSISGSIVLTVVSYFGMVWALNRFGITF
jgi:hypothetical protein